MVVYFVDYTQTFSRAGESPARVANLEQPIPTRLYCQTELHLSATKCCTPTTKA